MAQHTTNQKVLQAITIDVARADAMGETLVGALGRDRMKRPWRRRVLPIGLGVADVAARATEDFGLAVAGNVHEARGLVIDDVRITWRCQCPGRFLGFSYHAASLPGKP